MSVKRSLPSKGWVGVDAETIRLIALRAGERFEGVSQFRRKQNKEHCEECDIQPVGNQGIEYSDGINKLLNWTNHNENNHMS